MRKFLLALPLTLSLVSCTGEDVNSFTVKVIDAAIQTCDVVPSVATVAGLFNVAEVKIVADAVSIVCGFVKKPGATTSGVVPTYKGVPITWTPVKK